MKQDTLEGKAKTKNGVKRLCFSIICILLEVIFIITIVTRLNEYAEIINLFTRILSGILVLGLYASNKTSSMKMPWVILILIFPIMGVGLYLLIGLNGGTHKMRERYAEIDSKLLPMLPDSQECLSRIKETIPKAGNIASYIQRNSPHRASLPIMKKRENCSISITGRTVFQEREAKPLLLFIQQCSILSLWR